MRIGRADFARLLFFFFSFPSSPVRGFPVLSPLSRAGLRGRWRRQSGHADLREGLPGCKGNRANVSRPRGGRCMYTPREAFNQRSRRNLSLSLVFSLFRRASPRAPRDCTTAHVKAELDRPARSSVCRNTREIIRSWRRLPVISRLLMKITRPGILRRSSHSENSRTDSFSVMMKKNKLQESREKIKFVLSESDVKSIVI